MSTLTAHGNKGNKGKSYFYGTGGNGKLTFNVYFSQKQTDW